MNETEYLHKQANRGDVTPSTKMTIGLLGGRTFSGVFMSNDQHRKLFLHYNQEFRDQEHVLEEGKTVSGAELHENILLKSMAEVYAMREASMDGLRMMAVLSSLLEVGEDPVKLLIKMMSDAGYDVDADDLEWAEELA